MMKQALFILAVSVLLLGAGVCKAVEPFSLSPAAKAFETECINTNQDCTYENIRFESTDSVFVERHFYRNLKNAQTINAYNILIQAILKPDTSLGLMSVQVHHYDRATQKWIAFSSTGACKYCANASTFASDRDVLFRVDLIQEVHAASDTYIALGSAIYKNENMKDRIIVSPPSLIHPKDRSSIYIESRIEGHHNMTSFNKGGIIIDLSGEKVTGPLPDYVAISPIKSWNIVATEYQKRERALLKDVTDLPGFVGNSPEQRLTRIAHQLRSYKIQYDAFRGGVFPSLTPNEVIASKNGDCKALATLAAGLMKRSNIETHTMVLSESSLPPLSFTVPGHFWGLLHVLLYLPELNLYIDPTYVASFGASWKTSAIRYRGAVALDMTTGRFVVIH